MKVCLEFLSKFKAGAGCGLLAARRVVGLVLLGAVLGVGGLDEEEAFGVGRVVEAAETRVARSDREDVLERERVGWALAAEERARLGREPERVLVGRGVGLVRREFADGAVVFPPRELQRDGLAQLLRGRGRSGSGGLLPDAAGGAALAQLQLEVGDLFEQRVFHKV